MVIKSPSSNSIISTKNIDCVGFELKKDKNGKFIKRNGAYLTDKTKINVMFSSGQSINIRCATEEQGKEMFDTLFNAMRGIVVEK